MIGGSGGPEGPPVFALDGGGTKTASALLWRDGTVRALPTLPGCNPQDGPAWEGVLSEALSRADGCAAAVLGIPGEGEVPAHDAAVRALARALPCPLLILNDVALARMAAFGDGPGVLLLAGTGSMAWGPGGRVGGWGEIGDEGSAWWIGRAALSLAGRALDGREPDALPFARALCRALRATGPFAPLAWLMARGATRAAMAGVARTVDALPHPEADAILDAAAAELALAARVAGAGPWAPAGGAFGSRRLLDGVAARLGPSVAPRRTTLEGGLEEAARLAGWR